MSDCTGCRNTRVLFLVNRNIFGTINFCQMSQDVGGKLRCQIAQDSMVYSYGLFSNEACCSYVLKNIDLFFQDTLLALAKAVAGATSTLVLKAKGVASSTDDQGLQNKVINSATSCALATSQLVACTKVNV